MSLQSRELVSEPVEIPAPLEEYLQQVESLSRIITAKLDPPWGRGFYPSDFRQAYRYLAALVRRQDLRGEWFFEWGCGLAGVSACAAELGMRALGIEVDGRLIKQARRLLDHQPWKVVLAEGSFLPAKSAVRRADHDLLGLDVSAPSVWEQLPVHAGDARLMFAYPWPGEQRWIEDLFDEVAAPGAWLLCFRGAASFELWQKSE